ncbi:hypothetical protein MPER_08230 [Moniliophthora perniciosa FA553]|nr:hypothetical protein MPER_08230 [Moniliophthora perniciosa FA553]
MQDDHSVFIRKLQDQLSKSKVAHQQQIWELEGQMRDLRMELEDARSNGRLNGTNPTVNIAEEVDATPGLHPVSFTDLGRGRRQGNLAPGSAV